MPKHEAYPDRIKHLTETLLTFAETNHTHPDEATYARVLWGVANRHHKGLPHREVKAAVRRARTTHPWVPGTPDLPPPKARVRWVEHDPRWAGQIRRAERAMAVSAAQIDATPMGTPGHKAPDWSRVTRRD